MPARRALAIAAIGLLSVGFVAPDLAEDDPTKFLLYEAYESEGAASAHKDTDHYRKWRETVADWMAQPREGIAHTVVCPTERSAW